MGGGGHRRRGGQRAREQQDPEAGLCGICYSSPDPKKRIRFLLLTHRPAGSYLRTFVPDASLSWSSLPHEGHRATSFSHSAASFNVISLGTPVFTSLAKESPTPVTLMSPGVFHSWGHHPKSAICRPSSPWGRNSPRVRGWCLLARRGTPTATCSAWHTVEPQQRQLDGCTVTSLIFESGVCPPCMSLPFCLTEVGGGEESGKGPGSTSWENRKPSTLGTGQDLHQHCTQWDVRCPRRTERGRIPQPWGR